MDGRSRRPVGTAALVVVARICSVVAANGFLALLLDADVVPLPGAGPVVVGAGVLAAALAMLAVLARAPARALRTPLECAAAVYLLLVVAGAVAYAVARGEPADVLLYAGVAAISVFTLAATVLAALAAFVHVLLARATAQGAERPRWPWEDRFDP